MIELPNSVWEAMKAYCESLLPQEACGLLVGCTAHSQTAGSRLCAIEFVPVPNISTNPRHEFEMSSEALIEHIFQIQKERKLLIGFVHSHPTTPAIPSSRDANTLWKQTAALILSFAAPDNPVIRAYVWTEKRTAGKLPFKLFPIRIV